MRTFGGNGSLAACCMLAAVAACGSPSSEDPSANSGNGGSGSQSVGEIPSGTIPGDTQAKSGVLQVSPPVAVIAPGQKLQLQAKAWSGSGERIEATDIEWTSSDPGAATVSPSGEVSGVAAGEARISARSKDFGVGVTLVATGTEAGDQSPTAVLFEPPVVELPPNGTTKVSYTVYSSSGKALPGVSLAFDESFLATVAGDGTIAAKGSGGFVFRPKLSGAAVPLSGGLPVFVRNASECGHEHRDIAYVYEPNPLLYMARPGLRSSPLVTIVGEEYCEPGQALPGFRTYVRYPTPDEVSGCSREVGPQGTVLRCDFPGKYSYSIEYDGGAASDDSEVTVMPSLEGTIWRHASYSPEGSGGWECFYYVPVWQSNVAHAPRNGPSPLPQQISVRCGEYDNMFTGEVKNMCSGTGTLSVWMEPCPSQHAWDECHDEERWHVSFTGCGNKGGSGIIPNHDTPSLVCEPQDTKCMATTLGGEADSESMTCNDTPWPATFPLYDQSWAPKAGACRKVIYGTSGL